MSHAMPARRLRLGRVARSRASVRPSKQDATVGQGARGKVHVQYVRVLLCVRCIYDLVYYNLNPVTDRH